MSNEASAYAYPTDPTMLNKGLTKREYIAAIALSATNSKDTTEERVQEAVALTDALLKALNSSI